MRGGVLALGLALALLAGCTSRDDPPTQPTPEPEGDREAQAMLARAARELPPVFSVDMDATTTSGQTIGIAGTFDNATARTFLDLRGDPRLLESLASVAGAGSYLSQGLSIYVTPLASAYVANGSAFVHVEDPGKESVGSLLPNPASGPLGALLRGDEIVRGYAGEDVRVTSVVDATWEGEAAKEMVAQSTRGDARLAVAKLTVVPGEPPRIVHVRATLRGTSANDPLANATLEGKLLYEESDRIAPSRDAVRAIGLAYLADRSPADPRNVTWTFLASAGIHLQEVQLQVKVPSDGSGIDPGNLATAWVLPLDAGSRTEGNVTITFTDKDLDGNVSEGDTLHATSASGALPPLVLYDQVSGHRVVPGPWALLLLGALLAAALRRRTF